MKGKFIVLEGIDGSGSTTQAKLLANYLFDKEGYHVLLTKEPTELEIKIKPRLREDMASGINPFKEKGEEYVELYSKDRKQHEEMIEDILNKGVHVVNDRFKYSMFAYQAAQGQDMDELIERHKGWLVPDLILLLDLPAEKALERRLGDKTTPELFEKLDFQKQVRANYLSLIRKLPRENIVVVHASNGVKKVHKEIVKHMEEILE